jgi:hypothetical protein
MCTLFYKVVADSCYLQISFTTHHQVLSSETKTDQEFCVHQKVVGLIV